MKRVRFKQRKRVRSKGKGSKEKGTARIVVALPIIVLNPVRAGMVRDPGDWRLATGDWRLATVKVFGVGRVSAA
jgi:hypothetical protein